MVKNFGTLEKDKNHESIQITDSFLTEDASSPTTLKSPTSFTTATLRIVIPNNAVSVDLAPTKDLRVSEKSDLSSYTLIPADDEVEFGVAQMKYIYVAGDSAGGSLYFRFNLVA